MTRVRVIYRPPADVHNRVHDMDVPADATDEEAWGLIHAALPLGSEFRGMYSLDY